MELYTRLLLNYVINVDSLFIVVSAISDFLRQNDKRNVLEMDQDRNYFRNDLHISNSKVYDMGWTNNYRVGFQFMIQIFEGNG